MCTYATMFYVTDMKEKPAAVTYTDTQSRDQGLISHTRII